MQLSLKSLGSQNCQRLVKTAKMSVPKTGPSLFFLVVYRWEENLLFKKRTCFLIIFFSPKIQFVICRSLFNLYNYHDFTLPYQETKKRSLIWEENNLWILNIWLWYSTHKLKPCLFYVVAKHHINNKELSFSFTFSLTQIN